MPDAQIHPTGTVPTPADYVVPDAAELLLKSVYAKFDGTGAAGSYLPLVRIISDAGSTVIEAVADTTIAAGASADASWFPHLASKPSSAGGGIQFDKDNVGGSLEVETTGFVGTAFSQPASVTFGDDATNYGTAVNASAGTLFTADPALNGGGAPTVGVVNIEAGGTGTESELGQLIIADTSSGTGNAIGQRVEASGSTTVVKGVTIGTSSTSGACSGLDADAETTAGGAALGVTGRAVVNGGSAKAVGVQGRANVTGGGSGLIVALEGLDHNGNTIFQVRDDGSVHVKTGASTAMVADL